MNSLIKHYFIQGVIIFVDAAAGSNPVIGVIRTAVIGTNSSTPGPGRLSQ